LLKFFIGLRPLPGKRNQLIIDILALILLSVLGTVAVLMLRKGKQVPEV
jgi:hypothetical protein